MEKVNYQQNILPDGGLMVIYQGKK